MQAGRHLLSSKLLLNSESSVKLDQVSQDLRLSGLKQRMDTVQPHWENCSSD